MLVMYLITDDTSNEFWLKCKKGLNDILLQFINAFYIEFNSFSCVGFDFERMNDGQT